MRAAVALALARVAAGGVGGEARPAVELRAGWRWRGRLHGCGVGVRAAVEWQSLVCVSEPVEGELW